MITLEDIYNNSSSVSDIKNIPLEITDMLVKIGNNCIKHKGVYTVLTTLLLYKINNPQQDVRLHQSNMKGGFSGRTFDTKYVTPELARLGLPSMAESGWLTRSLEQPYPYDLNYNGKISGGLKNCFLELLNYLQHNPKMAVDMLRILLNQVIVKTKEEIIKIEPLQNSEMLTIDKIINALDLHFNYKYGTHNGAKLPVLAFYALYRQIISEVKRYENCSLSDLASLTACDLTSKASGDIEVFKNGQLFEAVEIKLNKVIDSNILRVVERKIYKYSPERYYILSYYGMKEDDRDNIQQIIEDVKTKHGCQIIVNGLLPTIKYYLRLVSSLKKFMVSYGELVEQDRELQKVHKECWNTILKQMA